MINCIWHFFSNWDRISKLIHAAKCPDLTATHKRDTIWYNAREKEVDPIDKSITRQRP